MFGQKPHIELIAFGGLTYPEGPKLKLWKEFIVVFDGPLFGFLLVILATILLQFPIFAAPTVRPVLETFRIVNIFWTLVNLLPVIPLDGGQLLRIVFESIFGVKGWKYSLLTSMATAGGLSLFFFLIGGFLIGALFFLFGFYNFEAWRKTRFLSESDRDENLKAELKKVENLLEEKKIVEATPALESLRTKIKKGLIFTAVTQHLAKIKYEKGQISEAYELLNSVKKNLSIESQLLFHKVAYEMQDFQVVFELAAICFQNEPTAEVAVRSATACAVLGKGRETIGWLKAALKYGADNIEEMLSKKIFDPIRYDPLFEEFLRTLRH